MLANSYRTRYVIVLTLSVFVHVTVVALLLWKPLLSNEKLEGKTVRVTIQQSPTASSEKSEQKDERTDKQDATEAEEKTEAKKQAEQKKNEPEVAPKKQDAEEVKPRKKAETKKAEPKKAEPKQAEPKKAEPKQAEPKKAEPKKAEPKKAEPKKAEPKKAEPKKAEAKKAEPKKAEPKKAEPEKAEPKKAEPKKAEPKKAEPKKAEPKKAEPKKAEPKKAEPKKLEQSKPSSDHAAKTPAKGTAKAGDPNAKPSKYVSKSRVSERDQALFNRQNERVMRNSQGNNAPQMHSQIGSMQMLTDNAMASTLIATKSMEARYEKRAQLASKIKKQLPKHELQEFNSHLLAASREILKHLDKSEVPKKDGRRYRGDINFFIDENGYIERIFIKRLSGNEALDRAMLNMLRRASQFPVQLPDDEVLRRAFTANKMRLYYNEDDML